MSTRRGSLWIWMGVLLVLGLGLRLHGLGEGSLFIDEAESSLNALSILEHGYPTDAYLGLPMFENTLTEPWPESEEYEFRDTSYSSRGMAIYHGWLPLYAIAAALALHGIGPDMLTDPPRVQHDQAEIQARIRAARLPAVAFAGLFLVAIFLAGRALYGEDAGLAAMLAAAVAPKCIWLAQQARYYSAGLALSTLAVACAWSVHRRGRWRDFLAAGLVFVLLFHTSSLAFLVVLLACALLVPGLLRHERAGAKLAAFAALLFAGLVPWMLWTGYLENAGRIPMARSFLRFPGDYLVYFHGRPERALAGLLLVATAGVLWCARARLARRAREALERAAPALLFLGAWSVVAFLGFQLLVPAASCSMARLSHLLVVAPILLGSIGLAAGARALWPERARWLSTGLMLALLLATGNVFRRQQRNPHEAEAVFQVVDHLRTLELARDTRLYALPTQHFCLSYYTGLPIQSIAPVRREFLERYPGEILIVETTSRCPRPPWQGVQARARAAGVALDEADARAWEPVLQALMIQAEVAPLVRAFEPEPGPQPAWTSAALAGLRAELEGLGIGTSDYARDNPAMFGGTPSLAGAEFWPLFFYRFVGAESRSGARLNYAGRMREASARMLPSSWIVLRCPARARARDVQ